MSNFLGSVQREEIFFEVWVMVLLIFCYFCTSVNSNPKIENLPNRYIKNHNYHEN